MKKKTAILVDAEWFRKILRAELSLPPAPVPSSVSAAKPRPFVITADVFYKNACLVLDSSEEELYRLFCYDSEPFANQLIVSTQTASASVSITAADIRFGLEQKGVDMRIGMDVASLSIKRLVERIILISGDTDMVPAIKLARREGVQVCVIQVGTRGRLSPLLIEDADIMRTISPMP